MTPFDPGKNTTPSHGPAAQDGQPAPDMPMVQLLVEVYESSTPAVQSRMLRQLIAKVYEAAPLSLRSRLLEHLLRPLGVLALVSVADGLFAKIRFRSGWPDLQVPVEEARKVRSNDLLALVGQVQQISMEAAHDVAQVLIASPMAASSAAAAVLVVLFLRRAKRTVPAEEDPDRHPPQPV